jgi:hypothetical protein
MKRIFSLALLFLSLWFVLGLFTSGRALACTPRHVENSAGKDWSDYLSKVWTACSGGCNLGTTTIVPVGTSVTDSGDQAKIYLSRGAVDFAGPAQLRANGVIAGGSVTISTDLGAAVYNTPALKITVDPSIYLAPLTGALANVGISHVIWKEISN